MRNILKTGMWGKRCLVCLVMIAVLCTAGAAFAATETILGKSAVGEAPAEWYKTNT